MVKFYGISTDKNAYYGFNSPLEIKVGDLENLKEILSPYIPKEDTKKIPKIHTELVGGILRPVGYRVVNARGLTLAISYHIPNFRDNDQVALSALSEILSSGKSSRLQNILIDKKRLVNTIYAYNMENRDPGIYLFMAICNPGIKAEDVEKEILAQIELVKERGISKEELDRVKANVKSDFIFG